MGRIKPQRALTAFLAALATTAFLAGPALAQRHDERRAPPHRQFHRRPAPPPVVYGYGAPSYVEEPPPLVYAPSAPPAAINFGVLLNLR
jgi:hypothetical protein